MAGRQPLWAISARALFVVYSIVLGEKGCENTVYDVHHEKCFVNTLVSLK